MGSIDELTDTDLHQYADKFFRLIGDHGKLHTKQLHEYVSLRLSVHLRESHKTALTAYAISKGGKRDKLDAEIIQMPVKRRQGLPGRKRDRKTVGMFEAHKVASKGPKLRWYQEEAIAAILTSLQENRSTLCVLPTGTGKTVLFASICKQWNGRVLVIAHREELISQARETLQKATGEFVGTEKAEYRAGNERLVVASIQTIHRRLDLFSPDHFSLIIIDEAHRTIASTYIKTIKHFTGAKVLGVTATPGRADEKAMGKVFEDVAYVMDIEEGIDSGYLVPLRVLDVFVEEVNLANVSTVSGDLAQGELDDEMLKATASVVNKTFEVAGEEQVIIFTPGVRSAHAMCEAMNGLAPGKAIAIDGKTDLEKRKELVAGFKRGEYQYLFNCAIATEGFDAPSTSMVALARPTKSDSLCTQMCGRGTRVLPGVVDKYERKDQAAERREAIAKSKKPRLTIIDFVGNVGPHTLAGPIDVLGGSYTDEEVKLAKKKAKASGEQDVQKVLKDARAELKAMAARMADAKVRASITEFDPFKCLGMRRQSEEYLSQRFGSQPSTEAQRATLKKYGFSDKDIGALDKRSAGKAIGKMIDRAKRGLASLWQIEKLSKHMKVPESVTFKQAMAGCEYLKRNPKPDLTSLQLILSVKSVSINDLF